MRLWYCEVEGAMYMRREAYQDWMLNEHTERSRNEKRHIEIECFMGVHHCYDASKLSSIAQARTV